MSSQASRYERYGFLLRFSLAMAFSMPIGVVLAVLFDNGAWVLSALPAYVLILTKSGPVARWLLEDDPS